MKKNLTPEKNVGNTANLIIFLGILYTSLSIASLVGCHYLSSRGYGITSVTIGCTIVALGYGTRYGSDRSLYAATFIFGALALYFAYTFFISHTVSPLLRSGLCIWACSRFVRTIPEMKRVKETGSSPDKESRYKSFFIKEG
ncbi:MAG: hypothetical protein D8M57_05955 [Candidatus Scalindua sp. AMX11]|nr:hypothetical protein [Planctomycetota bacterium]RZV86226.1 MAG: hypothetical protein EX341_07620 [Candidatus Scalindua sp. SCAELEC01]TDE65847.1 MAG: hypothetical protein D8M57_05955 [Candidatus Scalindua sp. AMX11]